MDNPFYRSTPLYKELLVLDLIEKNQNITQRQMSDVLNSSVAMTNNYISGFESRGLLKRKYQSTKVVHYEITPKGRERRKYLSVMFLDETQKIYDSAKEELLKFVQNIKEKGFTKILLYGAGEVAEIFLNAIQNQIEVLAVIDDNVKKQGRLLVNTKVISMDRINDYEHDGVLISSYGHHHKMIENLTNVKYPLDRIITFF